MAARMTQTSSVDKDRAMPLYQQVYLVIRENIRNGVYPVDVPMPTEPELCDLFNVSRITIKRALTQLASEGLVERTRGRGTFVKAAAPSNPTNGSLTELLKNVMTIGEETNVRTLENGLAAAPNDIAERLDLTSNKTVLKSVQIRQLKREPIALIQTYVPESIASKLNKAHAGLPMLAQLQKASIPIARADQSITATLADPITASHLAINIGDPLIQLKRLVFDSQDRPVEWLIALYRADHFEYRTSLTHAKDHTTPTPWQPVSNDI